VLFADGVGERPLSTQSGHRWLIADG